MASACVASRPEGGVRVCRNQTLTCQHLAGLGGVGDVQQRHHGQVVLGRGPFARRRRERRDLRLLGELRQRVPQAAALAVAVGRGEREKGHGLLHGGAVVLHGGEEGGRNLFEIINLYLKLVEVEKIK